MLAKRIIPCLDCQDGRVVKGVNFLHLRDAGDPGELAAVYNQEGADELVVLDISASREARATLMDTVRRVARQLFIPLTVGGGVRTLEDGRRLLAAGADKVAINTSAVERPGLIQELAARFGSQAVVVAIDARRARDLNSQTGKTLSGSLTESRYPPATVGEQPGPAWTVVTYGGTRDTGLDAFRWARQVQELGAGEILLTSMDTDGTENGFDCDLTQAISRAVHIPVIASGGAGMPQHFAEVFLRGAADAALAASIFHFRQHTISSLKQYLEGQGVPVRKAENPCCGDAL